MKKIAWVVIPWLFLACSVHRGFADETTSRLGLTVPSLGTSGYAPKINNDLVLIDSGTAVLSKANIFTGANTFNGAFVLGTPLSLTYGGTGQNWSAVTIGRLPYFSGTGTMSTLAAGTTGQILVSGGAAIPVWTSTSALSVGSASYSTTAGSATNGVVTTGSYADPSWITSLAGSKISGDVPTASSATNISGGSLGEIPYQSAADTTAFTSSGTLGQVLVSGGISSPFWNGDYVYAMSFGVTGDGTTDDTDAIQSAIDYAKTEGKSIIFGAGKFKINGQVIINGTVHIIGAGYKQPNEDTAGTPTNDPGDSAGTWFYVTNISSSAFLITSDANGTSFENVAFVHNQTTATAGSFTPTDFPATIHFDNAQSCFVRNVFFWNATRGILANSSGGGVIGRLNVNKLSGQFFEYGVSIDNALDVVKINDIHVYPFWSSYTTVLAYSRANCDAIVSARNDNPQLSNIFVIDSRSLVTFSKSSGTYGGITSKFKLINADCDGCSFGVQVTGDGTTGMIENFTTQGCSGATSGIEISTTNAIIHVNNFRATEFQNGGVYVGGSGSQLFIDNAWIQKWNMSGSTYPGIEYASGAKIFFGDNILYSSGGTGTINYGGAGSGYHGNVDSPTVSRGRTISTMTDNAGDTVTDMFFSSQSGARTYTVPDAGGNASFAMRNSVGLGVGTDSPTSGVHLLGTDTSNKAQLRLENNTATTGKTWHINSGNDGNLRITHTGVTDGVVISPTTGYINIPGVYAETTASAGNVFVSSDGSLQRSTSSKKYKTDIKNYTSGLDFVNKLRPVTYVGKNDKSKTKHAGLIAEEVDAAGLKEFVVYGPDGKPDAIEYQNMIALLVNTIKELDTRLKALERIRTTP
jgi:hypothetical protein